MLYLQNNSDAQSLLIPKSRETKGKLLFSAESAMNLTSFEREVIDVGSSAYYLTIPLTFQEGMPSGEYEYALTDEEGVVSTGILIVGDLDTAIEYTNNVEYEQYEFI